MTWRNYFYAFIHPYIMVAWLTAAGLFVSIWVLSPDTVQLAIPELIAGIVGIVVGFVIASVKEQDDARKERNEMMRRLFLGLYVELKHVHSYIEHIPKLTVGDFPSLPRFNFSSYHVVKSNGYFDIDEESHSKIEFVYRLLSNIDDQLNMARVLLIAQRNAETDRVVKICKDNIDKVLKNLPPVFEYLESTFDFNPETWDSLRDDWEIIHQV